MRNLILKLPLRLHFYFRTTLYLARIHPDMKILILVAFLFSALPSFAQIVATDNRLEVTKPTSQEALVIYQTMTREICNCTSATIKNSKPSTAFDTCYKIVLEKYTDTLKVLGYDPGSEVGQNKLLNEIRLYLCRDTYSLLLKEWAEEDAKKLLFKGIIVSQKQLPNGEVEVVMANKTTKERRTFKSTTFLNDPAQSNKKLIEYEMTVEYEVRSNTETSQNEYYI